MLNAILDIGNTKAKLALMENDQIIGQKAIILDKASSLNEVIELLKEWNTRHAILSTTKDLEVKFINQLNVLHQNFIKLSASTSIPLSSAYASPETLGMDRLAAAVGAAGIYPNTPIIIIDYGTCITLDLVRPKQGFVGGYIIPGLNMNLSAMHQQTDHLPLIKADDIVEGQLIGNDTKSSISLGAIKIVEHGVNGIIDELQNKYGKCCVITTGGDAKYFETKVKSEIFVHPNLVIEGLNKILTYNVSKA